MVLTHLPTSRPLPARAWGGVKLNWTGSVPPAGTVPVAFLWGVLPPLVCWRMLDGEKQARAALSHAWARAATLTLLLCPRVQIDALGTAAAPHGGGQTQGAEGSERR